MSKQIDATTTDLSAVLANSYIFKDRKGNFYLEDKRGAVQWASRIICTLFGIRTYQLSTLIADIAALPQSPSRDRNLELLLSKMAKGCGIQPELYKKIASTEKILQKNQKTDEETSIAISVFKDLCANQKLQKKLRTFQALLYPEEKSALDRIIERLAITKKWLDLGQDPHLCMSDYESVAFLVRTHIIYNIVGFQNTTADGASRHAIQTDVNGRISIKKEGQYVPVEQLREQFWINWYWDDIVDNETQRHWNYFSPDGLVPVNRYFNEEFVPIEQLSESETKRLLQHAKSFYNTDEMPPDLDAVIQVFTDPPRIFGGNSPLLSRLETSIPVHSAVRIITADGKVYSTGLGWDPIEHRQKKQRFSSVSGMPTIMDYMELRKHKGRIVTSVPVTSQSCREILETIQDYRKMRVRYNMISQNCIKLAEDVLIKSGVAISTKTSFSEMVFGALPTAPQLPHISHPVSKAMQKTPQSVKHAFSILQKTLLFLPSKLTTLTVNLVVYAMGAGSGSPQEAKAMEQFNTLISQPKDLLRDDLISANTSLKLMQWQLMQKSTCVYCSSLRPAMGILPQASTQESEQFMNQLHKKYLGNVKK